MGQPTPLSRRFLAAFTAGLAGLAVAATGPADSADAVTVVGDGTYGNDAPSVVRQGPWVTRRSPAAQGGSYANLAATGSASITFRGTKASWVANQNPYAGIADVYVDGAKTASVDLYAATARYQRTVYTVAGLRAGTHTVRIVRTGRKNAKSTGRNVTLDAFRVADVTPPPAPTRLRAVKERTGVRLSWAACGAADVAGYRVTRRSGTGQAVALGRTTAKVTTLLDAGLLGASVSYRVTAVDTSGNESGAAVVSVQAGAPTLGSGLRYADCPDATEVVADRDELLAALADAGPGTVIRLRSGRYWSEINVSVRGTADQPVWICGPRDAVFYQRDVTKGAGLRVKDSSHLVLAGFTVRGSQKGVAVMASDHVTVADLQITEIGDEAVHLKQGTTDSTVIGNEISRTGLATPVYGEGVYIGTAQSSWCAVNDCEVDRSDRNTVAANIISGTTADPIEAKEGTVGGTITGNVVDGRGMHADLVTSLIKVKGNGWLVSRNQGSNSPLDGIHVFEKSAGTGRDNVVKGNALKASVPGYAVRVGAPNLNTVVSCDNVGAPNSRGVTNVACQP